MKLKIVSGGQTGVDRAALDIALELGLPSGGWCPRGRRAEDGRIDMKYPLVETPSPDYSQRTEWNVRDSDGTLILAWGSPTGGTQYTIELSEKLKKNHLVIDLKNSPDGPTVSEWLIKKEIRVLNVAGPRSDAEGKIYTAARAFLRQLFKPGL